MLARGVAIYSLDPSAESISRLQNELDMGSRAKQGYGNNIPFEDGYFDKVIMTEVLEHIQDDDLHATLDEVRRVLKPGAEFTGTVPYREDLQSNEVFCPHCQSQFHRWGHCRSFDKPYLGSLLKQHGFLVKQLYPRSFPDFRRPGLKQFLKSIFRYVLGRMGETLVGPNLYFIAKKGRQRNEYPKPTKKCRFNESYSYSGYVLHAQDVQRKPVGAGPGKSKAWRIFRQGDFGASTGWIVRAGGRSVW